MPLKSADAAFDRVADEVLKSLLDLDPVRATWSGAGETYDGRLPDRSAKACENAVSTMQALRNELGAFREKELSPDRVVNLRLAKGGLNARVQRMQKQQAWKSSPCTYLEDIFLGIYALLMKNDSPTETVVKALEGRLRQAPAHLDVARTNLENPSPIFTESATLGSKGALEFFDTVLTKFVESVDEPGARKSLTEALAHARASVSDFIGWLEGDLMPRSAGEFAAGRSLFERLLADEHQLHTTSEDLIAIGQRIYQDALRDLKKVAARIDPDNPWSKVVENLKLDCLEEDQILSTYRSEVERARAYVKERGLVTVPDGESVEVVPTPEFARPKTPFASYLNATMSSGGDWKGRFWVTTIDQTVDEIHRESLLKGHTLPSISVTALHETYPGRHLQMIRTGQLRGHRLRHLFGSNLFSEGWALYSQDMICDDGFCDSDRMRMFQLKDLLWRACRVIIDVGIQTGKMGFNEAISFLVRKAHVERQHAVADVRSYCADPTRPMSGVIGKTQIEELLQDYKVARGSSFDLKTFHDELLSHGAIPIELIRMEMGIPHTRGAGRRHRRHG